MRKQVVTLLVCWLCLVASSSAGQGRQRDVVESAYGYEATCQWIEDNATLIQQRSGATVVEDNEQFLESLSRVKAARR